MEKGHGGLFPQKASRLWKKSVAAGGGDWQPRKPSAFSRVAIVGSWSPAFSGWATEGLFHGQLAAGGLLFDEGVAQRREGPGKVADQVESAVDQAGAGIELVDVAILAARLVDLDGKGHEIGRL